MLGAFFGALILVMGIGLWRDIQWVREGDRLDEEAQGECRRTAYRFKRFDMVATPDEEVGTVEGCLTISFMDMPRQIYLVRFKGDRFAMEVSEENLVKVGEDGRPVLR